MGCSDLQELLATGRYIYRLGAFPSWVPHNQPLSREDYIRFNLRCTVPATRNALCYFQRNFLKYLPTGLVLPPQMSKTTVVSFCISHLPPEHLNTSPASSQMTGCLNPYLDYLLWLDGYCAKTQHNPQNAMWWDGPVAFQSDHIPAEKLLRENFLWSTDWGLFVDYFFPISWAPWPTLTFYVAQIFQSTIDHRMSLFPFQEMLKPHRIQFHKQRLSAHTKCGLNAYYLVWQQLETLCSCYTVGRLHQLGIFCMKCHGNRAHTVGQLHQLGIFCIKRHRNGVHPAK